MTGSPGWGAAELEACHVGGPYIGRSTCRCRRPPTPCKLASPTSHACALDRCAQSISYDKTILVGSGHSSAVRLGSEPRSWSPNVEASLGEASTPGRRQGRPVDLKCPSAQAQIRVICRASDPPAGPGDSFASATHALELVQRLPVGQDSS